MYIISKQTLSSILETILNILADILQILNFESNSSAVREGKPLHFQFVLLCNTAYVFEWYHNENMITSSSTRFQMSLVSAINGTSIHTLYIAKTLQRDKGNIRFTHY